MHFNYRSKDKHNKSCFVTASILESFYKKRKKAKKENQKVANRKLGKVGNLGNLGKVISSFLVSEFSTWPLNNHLKDVNRQNAPLVDQHFKLPKHNFTG